MGRCYCVVIALFLLGAALGCSSGSRALIGEWEMIYPEYEFADTTLQRSIQIKILTDSHFTFGSMTPDGMAFAGGGRYRLVDSTYTEYIEYHVHPFLIGRELRFHCRLEGDQWYHYGSFDIDGNRFVVDEVWQRVSK
jgi:hypothetical protein